MKHGITGAEWRKSTYSNGQGDCIEIAAVEGDMVAVGDTKDPHSPALTFSAEAWTAFVAETLSGRFPMT